MYLRKMASKDSGWDTAVLRAFCLFLDSFCLQKLLNILKASGARIKQFR